ncbi:MAG: NAD(P)H-dependent oxidoreductase [Bacteroides sp.]|nr:NAD(P)H-dependent oxidoreductase [Bacteroides sp.]MCM1413685.1 NAD(P)H-dependent oxidoreductase [Bacteroides sp.]MCM1471864.1 NAD(P)H-dependent oxidoreductase [Bacteroides sp.]
MTTIVYCHPNEKSFNHEILKSITDNLTGLGREYDVMDLYADGFNPVLDLKDLTLYTKGQTYDPLVEKYDRILQQTDEAIFIFPIWWGMMPAMLKGWIDKVFLKGEIYDFSPEGAILPCLDIKKTTIVTTSQVNKDVLAPFVAGFFSPMILQAVGFNGVKWFNSSNTMHSDENQRREFIDSVVHYVCK